MINKLSLSGYNNINSINSNNSQVLHVSRHCGFFGQLLGPSRAGHVRRGQGQGLEAVVARRGRRGFNMREGRDGGKRRRNETGFPKR